jgi:hypothetical protein
VCMIFDSWIFMEMILPFLFVFVSVFAVLQKTNVLGNNARVDALIGLVIGLILIGFPMPRDILVGIMPWMAVGIAVIFVFLVLWGFVDGSSEVKGIPNSLKYTLMGLIALFVVAVVMIISGAGEILMDSFSGDSEVWMNVFMVLVIVGVVGVALKSGSGGGTPPDH